MARKPERTGERTCGNCRSIRFSGPHELYRDGGRCAKEKESGRCYVRANQEPCPLWDLRPRDVRERDAAKAAQLAQIVAVTNAAAHRRRRG